MGDEAASDKISKTAWLGAAAVVLAALISVAPQLVDRGGRPENAAASSESGPATAMSGEPAKNLVVWLSSEFGEGAAVIFDIDGTSVRAMTAKHVVWRGGSINDIVARFRQWPGREFAVKPDRFHHARDFAVVEIDLAPLGIHEAQIKTAFRLKALGDPGTLEPGNDLRVIGHSSSANWITKSRPAAFHGFAKARRVDETLDVIQIEEDCPPGHTGGAVFTGDWRLVGMVFESDQLFCRAWRIEWILFTIRSWQVGVDLEVVPD